jgi:pantoate--beta-alanine ligase
MTTPAILRTADSMRAAARAAEATGRRIVLVPTMGFLHDGHLALVREAHRHGDFVVVSIFVNPTQFGPREDLSRYPRDFDGDVKKLESVGVDAVFAPRPDDIYPPGFDTYVVPESLAAGLCGRSRPNHFRGVATVVLILLRICRCRAAVFGEKDYQQLAIIRRMCQDLWLDVEIVAHPIVRESDGLAKSSRNVYLSPSERVQALVLSRALEQAHALARAGERDAARLLTLARATIAEAPAARLDYAEVVDAETLVPMATLDRPAIIALAVFIGTTRLIDNRPLPT